MTATPDHEVVASFPTSYGNVVTVAAAGDLVEVHIGSGGPHYEHLAAHLDVEQAEQLRDALTEAGRLEAAPPAPAELETTGRGFYQYGLARTVDGLAVLIQESSAASGPHVWLLQGEKGQQVVEVDTLRFDRGNAELLRDALAWHVADVPNRWARQ